ncbi:MAG: ABC transporter permease [Gammaproteobacteria bacterium]
MFGDIQFAWRAVWSRPVYTLITVLVLALAIGANTTVFSVFNGFFLKPLPYPEDDRLVMVYNTYPKMALEVAGTSIPDYVDRVEHASSLESLAIYHNTRRTLGFVGAPEQVQMTRTTPSLFEVLGVAPALGRVFTDAQSQPGDEKYIVLSHALWSTRFGARPDIVGEDIRLDGEPYTVTGVMPKEFGFPSRDSSAWIPFAYTPDEASDNQRGREYSNSIGRLAPGATIEGLNAEMDTIVQRNVERLPNSASFIERSGFTGRAESMRDMVVGDYKQMLLLLQSIVLAVLLIACANVANLQLARIAARRKELSVRAALGAGRRRLAMLVITESLLLSLFGAVAGLGIAWGGLELVRWLGLDQANRGFEFTLDPIVLAFTALAALVAALVSALLPVWLLLRQNLAQAIQDAGRLGGGGKAAQGLRSTLVVIQVAVSVALLVGAGLLTKSFYALQSEGAGIAAGGVLTARVSLPSTRYADDPAEAAFFERALVELNALPGVSEVGYTSVLPFSGNNDQGSFAIDGYTAPDDVASPHSQQRSIDERYFDTIGVPIIKGRNFAARETDRVVIVDENLANRYWPDGDALGQRITRSQDADGNPIWFTIIGVVPAIKQASLAETPTKETTYWHHLQRPVGRGVFTLKTSLPPESLAPLVSRTILAIDPELPVYDITTMDQRLLESLGPQRTSMVLTLVFAGVAFVLAVIGIYGVLTWAVTQRVGEIGVRMALGARAKDIVRMVVRQGSRLTVVGLAAGIVGAIVLGRTMASQIHHVSALDPVVFSIVIGGLALAAFTASWFPARRASRIDPMTALRDE